MTSQRHCKAIVLLFLGAFLLVSFVASSAQGPEAEADPAAALLARDTEGRKWLADKEASEAKSLSPPERLRILLPWAERYYVPMTGPLATLRRRPDAQLDARSAVHALAGLKDGIDDAVRRSVAAKAWRPMGELASWEAFLARQGFRHIEDRPSQYIIGVRRRVYRRPPRLPQAIHTCLLTTREGRQIDVFGVTLRYAYPPEVAREIEELEREAGNYEKALALRLPAFRADTALLEALGKEALGENWPTHRERWADFIGYVSEPTFLASRAKVLEKKNPPTISEVRLLGGLAAHLYELGPTGRLEVLPQSNAVDLRGNPLYGARRSAN